MRRLVRGRHLAVTIIVAVILQSCEAATYPATNWNTSGGSGQPVAIVYDSTNSTDVTFANALRVLLLTNLSTVAGGDGDQGLF